MTTGGGGPRISKSFNLKKDWPNHEHSGWSPTQEAANPYHSDGSSDAKTWMTRSPTKRGFSSKIRAGRKQDGHEAVGLGSL